MYWSSFRLLPTHGKGGLAIAFTIYDEAHSKTRFQALNVGLQPIDHPLANAPFYPMQRLAEDPFIWIPEDRDMEMGQIFQEEGIHPNLRYTVNDDFAILAMVEQGLGVSIRPELVLQDTGRSFSAIPLERPRYRDITLAVRWGKPLSPLTARFLEVVRQWVAENPVRSE